MIRRLLPVLITSVLGMALSFVVSLPADGAPRGISGACGKDVVKLCNEAIASGQKISVCLKEKERKNLLSPACKRERQAFRKQVKRTRTACNTDMRQICAGEGNHSLQCLKGREQNLSPTCRREWKQARSLAGGISASP